MTGDSSRLTPAAMARLESPVRKLWQAKCTATSADEHAVSTVTDGPRRAKKDEPRLAMMLSAPPGPAHASTWLRSVVARYPYSPTHAPAKTPVCVCRSESAGIPACSRASYATSSNRRCCGSILAASLGEISKNSASNASMSVKNEPQRVVPDSAAATSGEPSSNPAHRSAGTSPTAEPPSHRNCQNASGPCTSLGKRQPRPTTAIGSSTQLRSAESAVSAWTSDSGVVRYSTRPFNVGCCQNSTGDTGRPSNSASSPDNTTASREPTPRSDNGASRSTSLGSQPMFVIR